MFYHGFTEEEVRKFETTLRRVLKNLCDEEQFKGLLLTGEVEVMTDHGHKVTAHKANYYHGLDNMDFIDLDFKEEG